MANILTVTLSVLTLLILIVNETSAAHCTRLNHMKKGSRKSGDGGYRLFIDGEPKAYQAGKIYNGLFILTSNYNLKKNKWKNETI